MDSCSLLNRVLSYGNSIANNTEDCSNAKAYLREWLIQYDVVPAQSGEYAENGHIKGACGYACYLPDKPVYCNIPIGNICNVIITSVVQSNQNTPLFLNVQFLAYREFIEPLSIKLYVNDVLTDTYPFVTSGNTEAFNLDLTFQSIPNSIYLKIEQRDCSFKFVLDKDLIRVDACSIDNNDLAASDGTTLNATQSSIEGFNVFEIFYNNTPNINGHLFAFKTTIENDSFPRYPLRIQLKDSVTSIAYNSGESFFPWHYDSYTLSSVSSTEDELTINLRYSGDIGSSPNEEKVTHPFLLIIGNGNTNCETSEQFGIYPNGD